MDASNVTDLTNANDAKERQEAVIGSNINDALLLSFKELLRKNPYISLLSKWDAVYYSRRQIEQGHQQQKKKSRTDANDGDEEPDISSWVDASKAEISQWVSDVQEAIPCCYFYRRSQLVNNCFCFKLAQPSVIVDAMMFLASQEKGMRQTFYKQFMQTSPQKRKVVILLPQINNNRGIVFCLHTFRNIFAIREKQFTHLRAELQSGNPGANIKKMIGNKNRQKRSMYETCKDSVVEYLNEFGASHGEPMATRFVREMTGVGLRDEEVDLLQLPSHYTKRGIYCGYVYKNGYKMPSPSHKGSYGKVSDYKKRCDDPNDNEWPNDLEPFPVCSQSQFHKIWSTHCPKVVIRPKSEDICGDCYVFKNKMKYGKQKNGNPPASDDESSNSSKRGSSTSGDEEQRDGDELGNLDKEDLILQAARHVTCAREQREAVRRRQNECRQQVDNNTHIELSDTCYIIVVDFAQNMECPHFGGEQPGETYYYSPKNIFVFGVCNLGVPTTPMYAYCYEEETAKKGGNNVASLLMHHLELQGMLPRTEEGKPKTAKRLTIACDNCAGQNKNNMVICLANYLVEKGHFDEVEFLFYVKGHTKNACDRSFNLMKMKFRKNNIYTYKGGDEETSLLAVIGTADQVHPIDVPSEVFRDYNSILNKLYKTMIPNTLSQNHSFIVSRNKGATILQSKTDEGPGIVATTQDLEKKGLSKSDRENILTETPPALKPPGLRKIKQVDLYNKYRPLLPPHLRDITCPKPSNKVIDEVATERRQKAKGRRQQKKSAEEHNEDESE